MAVTIPMGFWMRKLFYRIIDARIRKMGSFRKAARLALSAIAAIGLTGATLTDYSRVECLAPQQQLPIYGLTSSYAFEEDDPATPEDEREYIEHEYHSSSVVFRPGYVLTASHSVAGPYDSIVVHTPLGDREAVRIASDPVNDMALLQMDTTGLQMLPINRKGVKLGQQMWNVGYPTLERPVSFSGPLLGVRGGSLYLGIPAFTGMSGGGVVGCSNGEPVLMGIIESFNMRLVSIERENEEGKTIIRENSVNLGTSNAPNYMLLLWFTEFAIAIEEELGMREQEQE